MLSMAKSRKYSIAGSRPDWTQEEDDLLRRLWATGMGAKQVALYIEGRSWSAVKKRRMTLGLPRKREVETKDQSLRVNLTEREYWQVRQRATSRGLTVAEYLRQLIRADHEDK